MQTNRAGSYPDRIGLLNDFAQVLPGEKKIQLEKRLRAHKEKTGRTIVVVTVETLRDVPVDDYAHNLAVRWDLHDTKKDVVMLLAAKEERFTVHALETEVVKKNPELQKIFREKIVPILNSQGSAAAFFALVEGFLDILELKKGA